MKFLRYSHTPFWVMCYLGVGLLLLGLSTTLVTIGGDEYQQSRITGDLPQRITCAELGEQGYGDNAHIELTNFRFLDYYFVDSEPSGPYWQYIFVPIVPIDQQADDTFLVLIRARIQNSDLQVANFLQEEKLAGVIRNDKLEYPISRALNESYPQADLEQVVTLEIGGFYLSRTAGRYLMIGSSISFGIGLFMVVTGLIFASRASKRAHMHDKLKHYSHRDPRAAAGYERQPGREYDTVTREKPREPDALPAPQVDKLAKFVLADDPRRRLPSSSAEIVDAEIIDNEIIDAQLLDDDPAD